MSTRQRGSAAADPGHRGEAILADLQRVRLLTGRQLERLHFAALADDRSRSSARRRSLGRLTQRGWVTTLPRRVGGERAGSAGLVYTLDRAGQQLLATGTARIRRPWAVGWPFVQHTLDVAELYVRLREQERHEQLHVLRFDAEPAAWHRLASGITLKPDAFAALEVDGWEYHYWLEVDRGTESLPTLRRQLATYLDAANLGEVGPLGVMPLVVVTVPTVARRTAVAGLVAHLPEPAGRLLTVWDFADAFVTPGRPPP